MYEVRTQKLSARALRHRWERWSLRRVDGSGGGGGVLRRRVPVGKRAVTMREVIVMDVILMCIVVPNPDVVSDVKYGLGRSVWVCGPVHSERRTVVCLGEYLWPST